MSSDSLRIGELSERTGVPRHTIRFYERTGVLPPPARTRSGYRAYRPEAVERLDFIRRARTLGLKLADIADVLQISGERGCRCVAIAADASSQRPFGTA